MRSSLILGVALLLTIAAPSIVQACKEHTCGNLGPGSNACKCGEIVVKAAKVQKPLFYASPEAINEAAVAREAVGRLSVGTDRWQSESVASFPKYKPCASGTFSSCSSSSSSSSSNSISSSSSSNSLSSLSSLSSGGIFGGLVGGSGSYLPFNSATGRVASSCGCGKTSESLEVHDLLSSNVQRKVVPSFAPIGDLCYPSPPNSKFQVTTKVIPASPGKIKCAPPIPYEVCVQVLNGQIDKAGLKKLGLASAYSGTGATLFDRLTSGSAAASGVASAATRYGGFGGFGSFGGYRSYGGAGASSSAGSTAYGYGSYGAAGGIGQSSTRASSFAGNSLATSSNVGTIQGSATSYRSNSEFTDDFGDDPEFPEDYSYPRLPADPVSVTLAYKNLFPRTVYYNRRAFVPEDKLAFGHRTVPTESCIKSYKKIPDIPEERLQILDKPVVELKPVSPIPITIGAYDEHEEAKLAELEAIERERINQEEIAERQQENFITYGDLGYAPINRVCSPLSAGPINAEDDTGADCGPVGPPIPDYVPGSVVVDRELVEHDDEAEDNVQRNNGGSELYVRHYAGDETSDEEDDCDDPTSGIFARLRSVARKSHGYPRGAV